MYFLFPFMKTHFHSLYIKVLLAVSMLFCDWNGVDKNWEIDI